MQMVKQTEMKLKQELLYQTINEYSIPGNNYFLLYTLWCTASDILSTKFLKGELKIDFKSVISVQKSSFNSS